MAFGHITEPYVDGTIVREFLGGVSHVTLWRWCQEGLPYHLGRNGRRMYRLSEVEAWFFDSACTAPPAGRGVDDEGVA
jgi:hypothetical protein